MGSEGSLGSVGDAAGSVGPAQLMSAAARRVYGPVAPPR